MPTRRRLLGFAALFPALGLALGACAGGARLEHEEPRDYWFEFLDKGILSGPAELNARIRFGTGEELVFRLTAHSGDSAGGAARHWAQQLNRQRPMTSNSDGCGFSIRHVLAIQFLQGLRGVQYRPMTAEESAVQFDPTTGLRIDF